MRNTFMFPIDNYLQLQSPILTIIFNFTILFYISNVYFQTLLYKYCRFLHFYMIPAALLLITVILFSLKLITFIACSLKDSQNLFVQFLALYASCLLSMLLNDDIWKTLQYMFSYFCFKWVSWIIFTSINLFYYTFKICINVKYFIIFFILVRLLIVLLSEGIIIITKIFVFSYVWWNSDFFPVAKEWRQSDNQNYCDV